MKAKYLGVISPEDDGPRRVGFAGKSFPRGIFIAVDDIAAALKAKLSAHPHFEVSDEPLSDEDVAAADAVNGTLPTETEAADAPSGKPALLARLEAMKAKHPEVTFDARWGEAKLRAALESAEFEHGDD